jgi:glutathione S-transferase
MKLVASKLSPYARKVRIVLAEKSLPCELVAENVWDAASRIRDFNPLGKVPVLVTDEGEALFDSVAIVEYLDPLRAPRLIPDSGIERARVRRDEALGDGISDAGVTIRLESLRESARQDAAWIARQKDKVERGVAAIAKELGTKTFLRGDAMTLGDVACGCALLWLEFRLPQFEWRASHANLRAWAERLEARAAFASTRPQDA